MKILSVRDGNDGQSKKKGLRALLGIGIVAGAIAVSSTLAANININSGPVEFGQGVAQTVSCSGEQSVIVTPDSSFINTNIIVIPFAESGWDTHELDIDADSLTAGMEVTGTNIPTGTVITEIVPKFDGDNYNIVRISTTLDPVDGPTGNLSFGNNGSFKLSSIMISDIPAECANKVFTIKIYDNENSTPLSISDFGDGDTSAMVWWANGARGSSLNEAVLNFPADNRTYGDWYGNSYNDKLAIETNRYTDIPSGAFRVNLPKSVDATKVYKITVETQDDSPALNIGNNSSFYGWWN